MNDTFRLLDIVALTVDSLGVADALHRAIRAWRDRRRRAAIQERGMRADWSWELANWRESDSFRAELIITKGIPSTPRHSPCDCLPNWELNS